MKISDFLKGTLKYDEMGQDIWLVEEDGNHQKIVDLRGWGRIQYLFKLPNGELETETAAKFQDELGQWIVDALMEKLEREKQA